MSKQHLVIVGKTPSGQKVVAGVFRMFDTIGLPLDVIFDECRKGEMIPSWTHFYDDAIKYGWSHKTTMNRLQDNISDVYGKPYADVVIARLVGYSS